MDRMNDAVISHTDDLRSILSFAKQLIQNAKQSREIFTNTISQRT